MMMWLYIHQISHQYTEGKIHKKRKQKTNMNSYDCLLVHFGDDIWVWAHGKEERGGEPQFGGSGNGRYNNFYRTIITINKGGLPSLKYVAKQYKYSPMCLQIFEIRAEKEKWLFHSNGNRIEAFLFISFVCFLRQLWQSFCPSQKAPLIAFQTNCLRKMFCFNTKVRD